MNIKNIMEKRVQRFAEMCNEFIVTNQQFFIKKHQSLHKMILTNKFFTVNAIIDSKIINESITCTICNEKYIYQMYYTTPPVIENTITFISKTETIPGDKL